VAEAVYFFGADTGDNMGGDHVQNIGGELTGHAHFFDFGGGFNDDAHEGI
jgi:hypothetical protein